MLGLMMDGPLLIAPILEYAAAYHGFREIVSRNEDNSYQVYSYADCAKRTRKLAHGLMNLGIKPGDRIGTLAWNNYRHFELYFAVPGIGAVCHTINPRLYVEQVEFILNHAEDRFVFVDPFFFPVIEPLAYHLKKLDGIVVMCDRAHMPQTPLTKAASPKIYCYEDLLDGQSDQFEWPHFDEKTASGMCYTSGTTGHPKGVLYTHRSTVLHAMAVNQSTLFGIGSDEVVMPVVPMFHVNAWGIPYSAPLAGAKLILPGPRLDGPGLLETIHTHGVTFTSGVPTIWLNLLNTVDAAKSHLKPVRRVSVGGAAVPQTIFERFAAHGIITVQGWGMTETSPLGSVSILTSEHEHLNEDARMTLLLKAGRAPFGVDMRITGDDGKALPRDGVARGQLEVRGPWITCGYYNNPDRSSFTKDGWFQTGDIATIDPAGFMNIVDRSKDVIKSGGEWISSIELENLVMSHPSVLEAAVIARADTQWTERPRLLIVLKPGMKITPKEVRAAIEPHVAKWWIPEDYIIIPEMPHTATGKVTKLELRAIYGAEKHPDAVRL